MSVKLYSNVSGFPELMPDEQLIFHNIIKKIKEYISLYGFVEMDLSPVEKLSTLLSKGGDNEIYGLYRASELNDNLSKTDLGLRFDLTVPFGRYIGTHGSKFTFPYKRYQISQVWRGERAQSGRYRQFYQCDFDIISDKSINVRSDAEIIFIMYNLLLKIIGNDFTIKINNIVLLKKIISSLGVAQEKIESVIKIIDKFQKISSDEFCRKLNELSINDAAIEKLNKILLSKFNIKNYQDFFLNNEYRLNNDDFNALEDLIRYLNLFGVTPENLSIDFGIARGLNYYTGNIFEIYSNSNNELGSIGAGGRYENFLFGVNKKEYNGVGASIGITRILLLILSNFKNENDAMLNYLDIVIVVQDEELIDKYFFLAELFRKSKIKVDLYSLESSVSSQIKYADKKRATFVCMMNKDEFDKGVVLMKRMSNGDQFYIEISELNNYDYLLKANIITKNVGV